MKFFDLCDKVVAIFNKEFGNGHGEIRGQYIDFLVAVKGRDMLVKDYQITLVETNRQIEAVFQEQGNIVNVYGFETYEEVLEYIVPSAISELEGTTEFEEVIEECNL